MRQVTIVKEMVMSTETATNWSNYCRQVYIDAVLEYWSFQPTGGVGNEVDIDESLFSRLVEYGRGENKTGDDWVFGGIEWVIGENTFVEMVARRDTKTLISLIQKWIRPGSIIYSYCWNAYSRVG